MSKLVGPENPFNNFMTKIFDLCLLNILTLVFCIPVVTAGASLTAMYAVMMKMAGNEEGGITKTFWKEFRLNLKGSFGGWLFLLALMALLVVDLALWAQNDVDYKSVFYGITVAMLVFITVLSEWYFAVRAKFEETSSTGLKNALKFLLIYLPASIIMGLYTLGIFLLAVNVSVLIFLSPLIGLAVLSYPKAFYIRKKFSAYIKDRGLEPSAEEEAKEDSEESEEEGELKRDPVMEKIVSEESKAREDALDRDAEIINRVKEERKQKWAAMSKKEKAEYIFTYYKAWMVTGVIIIAAIAWALSRYVFSNSESVINVALINGYMRLSDTDMSETLDEYFELDSTDMYTYFDTQYQLSYTGVENTAGDTSFYEKFFLNVRVGSLDAVIMPESFMEYCNSLEPIFADVTEILDEERLDYWEDYLVMGTDEDGNEYACGLDISHLSFIKEEEMGFVGDNDGEAFILAFPVTGEAGEACQTFLEFLESYEEED